MKDSTKKSHNETQRRGYLLGLVIGISLVILSIILYYQKSVYWYYPPTIGWWLIFDYLSHRLGNATTLGLIIKAKQKQFFTLYFLLLAFSFVIEIVGSITLDLWSYKLSAYTPTLTAVLDSIIDYPLNGVGYLLYPFILMHFRELYQTVQSLLKNRFSSTSVSMIAGILIWEVPNLWTLDWIYTIPFITMKIAGINIIVILGWVILIEGSVWVYHTLDQTTQYL